MAMEHCRAARLRDVGGAGRSGPAPVPDAVPGSRRSARRAADRSGRRTGDAADHRRSPVPAFAGRSRLSTTVAPIIAATTPSDQPIGIL